MIVVRRYDMMYPDWLPDYMYMYTDWTQYEFGGGRKKETPRNNPDIIDAEFTVRETILLDSK